MPVVMVHHRFSVEEYEQMIEHGILTENDRVELIRGEIIDKMSIGDQHVACVNRLNRFLNRLVGDQAIVSIQNPIRLAESEPGPDVSLLRPRDDFYESGKPQADDVLLVVEVADTTLDFDREVKLPLYAEAGIEEYWIVNIPDGHLEVYRLPQPNGTFLDVQTLRRGQDVQVAGLPGVTLTVADLL